MNGIMSGLDDEWCPISGFSGYFINEFGEVLDRRSVPTSIVSPEVINKMVIVRLKADNAYRPHPVSLDELMLEAFIDIPDRSELYDLVHIDGDLYNCRADNYGWKRKFIPRNVRD